MSVLMRHTILVSLVLLLIACAAVRGDEQFITREEAIDTALQIARAPQPELSGTLREPTNVQAERMRLIDAYRRLDVRTELGAGSYDYDNEAVVWLVTMEGIWTDEFPRPPDVPEPGPYHHYAIILDATNGTTIMVWSHP